MPAHHASAGDEFESAIATVAFVDLAGFSAITDVYGDASAIAARIAALAAPGQLLATRPAGTAGSQMLMIALGTLRAFQIPAQHALIPSLVPAELLPRALAFRSSGLQATIIAGPALGGLARPSRGAPRRVDRLLADTPSAPRR